jgi:hypothetical protein
MKKNKNIEELLDRWGEGNMSVQDLSNELYILFDVSNRRELLKAFYAYIDDKWALGMLTDKVDEVIEGFEKSL